AVATLLSLAGRALPAEALVAAAASAPTAVDDLVAAGVAVRLGGLVTLSPACATATFEPHDSAEARLAAARLLAGGPGFDPDPWAYARAGELLVAARAYEEADSAIE